MSALPHTCAVRKCRRCSRFVVELVNGALRCDASSAQLRVPRLWPIGEGGNNWRDGWLGQRNRLSHLCRYSINLFFLGFTCIFSVSLKFLLTSWASLFPLT